MRGLVLLGSYAAITAVCIVLAFVISGPGPGDASDGFSHLISGAGLSIAACIFFKDAVGIYETRRASQARTPRHRAA